MSLSIPGAKHLAHKALLATALKTTGHEAVAPETHLVRGEADVAKVMDATPPGEVWFLKNPAMQRGQGVFIIRKSEEANHTLNSS